jgi:membrane protease YdiL (CAAX protease family)
MTHAVNGCPGLFYRGCLLVSEIGGKLLAQADPHVPQIPLTSNQALALALGLTLFVASIMTGTLWCRRVFRIGHSLPQANRRFLRVPPIVTYFTGVISLMWVLAQISVSFQPVDDPVQPEEKATTAAAEQAAEQIVKGADGSASTVSPDHAIALNSGSADSTTGLPAVVVDNNSTSQEKLRNARDSIFAIILFNVLLSTLLGGSVFLATMQERRQAAAQRVWESGTAAGTPFGEIPPAAISGDTDLAKATVSVPYPHSNSSFSTSDSPPFPSADLPRLNSVKQSLDSDNFHSEPFRFLLECRYAVEIFLAAWFPTMLLRFLMVELISGLTGKVPESNPLLEMLGSGVGRELMVLIAVTAVIVAPLAEELQFRIVLLGGVVQAGRKRIGWILSSVLFALAHGFPDSLALFPLSFTLGYAYMRRRSYLTVVLVHFLFNLSNIAMAVLAMS